jgi:hypothetical protein
MASKIPQKEKKLGTEGSETLPDSPLLDPHTTSPNYQRVWFET